jgi:hypothetical protein
MMKHPGFDTAVNFPRVRMDDPGSRFGRYKPRCLPALGAKGCRDVGLAPNNNPFTPSLCFDFDGPSQFESRASS